MSVIYIGKVVKPHGVHGEIKINSNFEYKSKYLIPDNKLILKLNGESITYKIVNYNYKTGKKYDICKLDGINTMNDAYNIRNANIYMSKEDNNIKEITNNELISMDVLLDDKILGYVDNITSSPNILLVIKNDNNTYYIPKQDIYIKSISLEDNKIILNDKAKELL